MVAGNMTLQAAHEAVHRLAKTRVKLAELGGAGNDIPFEQAMSNLAHAYMRDKAPTLLDHEQGFQLLERDTDNTKAIGVIGFKVGSSQLYSPIFFLKGSLKGHELLYIKNQDLFVPLKENWLNYILNRKPATLGQGVSRNSAQLGVRGPALDRLSSSPYKYASVNAVHPFFRDALPAFCSAAYTNVKEAMAANERAFDMPTFLKQASLPMLNCLVQTMQSHPAFAAQFEEYHGLDVVADAIYNAHQRQKVAHSVLDTPAVNVPKPAVKQAAIKVVRFDLTQITSTSSDVSEEDQAAAMKDGVLIQDARGDDDVSIPVNVRVEQVLTNPTESGLYEVLVKPGEYARCYVAISPVSSRGRHDFATVVRVEGKPDWVNTHPTRIFVGSKIDGREYDDWFESLKTPDSLSVDSKRCLLVGPRGNTTTPFRVRKTTGDVGGEPVYDVDFSTYCDYRNESSAYSAVGATRGCGESDYSWHADGSRIHLNGKSGTALRFGNGDVYVPKGFKILPVEPSAADTLRDDECCDVHETGGSQDSPLMLGNLADAELAIRVKTAALSIIDSGHEFAINDRTFSPVDSLVHLVVDHGLRQAAAEKLLKQAKAERQVRCRIKYANPYLTQGAPSAPTFPEPQYGGGSVIGYQGETQPSQEQFIPVDDMSSRLTDPAIYNQQNVGGIGPQDMAVIQRAMQTGQKNVFDVSVIGSMLKSVRDDTMIDRYIPDLVKGMDRVGRILFFFYWRGDQFAERYGKADMPELEDSLRNTFEALGDCVLFLKQKTVEPYPEEGQAGVDLGQVAGA